VAFAARGLWGWLGLGAVILLGAAVAQAQMTVKQTMVRDKALPKPEMTVDDLGRIVPRLVSEGESPLSIHIEIPEAKDVPAMDGGGTSDPYIIVTLFRKQRYGRGNRKSKWVEVESFQTPTIEGTLTPVWNAAVDFGNPRKIKSSQLKLVFTMYDEDVMADDKIGEFELPDLTFLDGGMDYDDWEFCTMDNGDDGGEVHVILRANFDKDSEIRTLFEMADDDNSGYVDEGEPPTAPLLAPAERLAAKVSSGSAQPRSRAWRRNSGRSSARRSCARRWRR
jgi:hypothetical protein